MTSEGNRDISLKEYMEYTDEFGVDSYVTLNDEVPLTIGKRRGKQSVLRNEKWLKEQLETAKNKEGIIANIQVTERISWTS